MRLLEVLQHQVTEEDSYFRAQLLREDVERLKMLQELARSAESLAAFKQAGSRIGWTAGDARTHELREPLDRFLEAVFALEGRHEPDADAAIEAAWRELHRTRMERLLGCLSTPVPRPAS